MSKIFKFLLIGLASVLLLVVLIIGGIFLFVDPNDYKSEITNAVYDATGRDLTITGDISLSVFPWLGLSLGSTNLSNARGFEDTPFASVKNVDIKVKLLPLLQQRLEMQKIRLHGLRVNLAKDITGRSNWDDLVAPTTPPIKDTSRKETKKPGASEPAQAIGALANLSIEGLELEDAHLEWNDQQTNHHIIIDKLILKTGPLALPAPMDVSLSLDLQANQPEVKGHVIFNGQVAADLNKQQYRVNKLDLKVNAQGTGLPVSPVDARLQATMKADLAQQVVNFNDLQLDSFGAVLSGHVNIMALDRIPEASGQIQLANVSPRELANKLGIHLPESRDKSVLTKANAEIDFSGNQNQASLKKLSMTIDDTTLTGTASVKNFSSPVIRFNLDANSIDVDRYLPPPADKPSTDGLPPTPGSTATASTQLPLEPLRTLDVDGTISLDKIKVVGAQLSEMQLGIKGKGGQIRLHPVQASLYNGQYHGDIELDVRTDTPNVSANEKLTTVKIGPLLKDVVGKEFVSGTANITAQLTTSGTELDAMKKTLNGQANFQFQEGKVKGVNIGQMIREAYAKLKKKPAPPKTENTTDFAEMSGSVAISNGIIHNNDLNVKSPLLRIKGNGQVDLPRERVNYQVNTAIVESQEGQTGKELEELKSLIIPIKVTGKLTDPNFGLDLDSVLKARTKKVVEKEKKKLKEKIDKQLEEKKEELVEDLKKKFKLRF